MRRSCVLLSSIIGVIISGFIIIDSASALEYQSNPVDLNFEFGSTLELVTDGNISISNVSPNTTEISDDNYKVTVNTNNLAGYTLTATVGCSAGVNCYNNKTLSDGTNTFSMVTSTSGVALAAGEWGYTTAQPEVAIANVFKTLALYNETPTILNKTKDANGTAYDSNYIGTAVTPFQIGAHATSDQAAGTYTNVINFSAVANPIPTYSVALTTTYADTIIIDGTSYANGDSPTLTQGLHRVSGTFPVSFSSWSATGGVAVTNTTILDTTIYITGAGTLTLTGVRQCSSTLSGNMQDFYPCSSIANGTTGTMTDIRNGNKTYTVAKINGKIWMTQNLDLPGGTTLTPADTNVPEDYYTTTTGFVNGNTLPASYAYGFSDNDAAEVYNSGSTTCSSSSPCYSYYTWLAATAGYKYYNNTSIYDICPNGWRLPTDDEYVSLRSIYTDGNALVASPWLGVRGGNYYQGSFENGGILGYYWSSTSNVSGGAYGLAFAYTQAYTVASASARGYSIRCIVK